MDWPNFNDERWNFILNLVVLFNAIPAFMFITYVVLASLAIVSSALLAELFSVVFGLVVLVPVLLCCTLGAVFVGGFFLVISSALGKSYVKDMSTVSSKQDSMVTAKKLESSVEHIHSD